LAQHCNRLLDVANGEARTDLRPGALAATGRPLDVAIHGSGFFVVKTPQGAYTRNGHLVRGADGALSTDEGDAVLGVDGPIKIDGGTVDLGPDGTVRNSGGIAGKLKVVDLGENPKLQRTAARVSAWKARRRSSRAEIVPGSLEQSNVSMAERVAELSDVAQFRNAARAVSVLMNDVDRGAITELVGSESRRSRRRKSQVASRLALVSASAGPEKEQANDSRAVYSRQRDERPAAEHRQRGAQPR
jgi:flagellar basal body rod protein FlgG